MEDKCLQTQLIGFLNLCLFNTFYAYEGFLHSVYFTNMHLNTEFV